MDFAACPKCGAMNAPEAVNCAECRSALCAEADAPPSAPPPFEAAPEVLAQVAKLEADLGQRPQARALYPQLAQIYVDNHRIDLAVTALERGLAVDPHNATFHRRIAQLTGRSEARVTIPGVTDAAAVAVVPVAAAQPAAPATAVARAGGAGGTTARAAALVRPAYSAPRQPRRSGLSRGRMAAIAAVVAGLGLGGWLVLRPSARRIVRGDFRASSPVWAPTGRHLAFLITDAKGSRLGVYDFKAGAHRIVGPVTGWDEAAASWSLDGLRLAYVAPGQGDDGAGAIYVYDLSTGQTKKVAAGSSPQWRPGGQLAAVCTPEPPAPGAGYGDEYEPAAYDFAQHFCRIDPASGAVTWTALAADWGMALSPLLDRVVFERSSDSAASTDGQSGGREFDRLVDNVLAGRASNVAEGSRDLNRELEARRYAERKKAPQGDAARIPPDVEVFAADLDRGEPVRLAPAGQAAYPRWTAAGDRILFAANGASGIEFWTMGADGGDRQPVLQGVNVFDAASVRLSADGKEVFFVARVEGDPGVSRLMTGEEPADLHVVAVGGGKPRRLSSKHPFKHRYAVSPDGRRIAYEVLQDVTMIGGAGRSEIWVMSR